MLHYILQTVAFQLFFLIIYDVFLKKETFFNWNRLYLLITGIASVVLPFIKVESIRTIVPEQFVIRLPEVIIGDVQSVTADMPLPIEIPSEAITDSNFVFSWDYLLFAGMILATLIFIYKIIKISILIHKSPKQSNGNLIIVNLLKSNAAFSFFNYVFLGEWIKEKEKETILKHELVHVHQKHSLDLILFELLRILFWFNPLVYIYQNRITTLHEYIADAQAMKQSDKKQYYEKLLSQVFHMDHFSFTNTFFNQSLIKKRIVMLSKPRSRRTHLLKYALLIPMIFGMLVYTSSYSQKEISKNLTNQELTFQELTDKYYNEIKEMSQNGAEIREIQLNYDMSNDKIAKEKYIKSMDEMAKIRAYIKYSSEAFVRTEEEKEYVREVLNRYKTYEDYVAYQKTDEAKSNWESDIHDGEVRLIVNDMKNLSAEEQNKLDKKIALIKKDYYFYKLKMTDGTITSVWEIEDKATVVEDMKIIDSEDIEVPFSVIDEVPTTENCNNLSTNEEKRNCFSNYIADFVNKNFNTNLAKELNLTGKQRISVLFKIGKDGNIGNVIARAPHPALEEEAKRVIKALPKMIPGKQKGEPVIVPYSLPILFQVQEDVISAKSSDEVSAKLKSSEDIEFPFSIVEVAPISKECQKHDSEKERRSCTTDIISSFVNENFNTKIAKEKELTGAQRIAGFFRIDTNGFIIDVKARAQNEELQLEALRVMSSLPQMIPGKHNGKPVIVSYSLPIIFQINE